MNGAMTILASVLLSGAVATAVVLVVQPESDGALGRGSADGALANANARVLELEDELARIDERMDAYRRMAADADALFQTQPAKLAAIEAALARLEGRLAEDGENATALRLAEGEEVALAEIDDLIESRVKAAVEKSAKQQRRRPLEAFEPMIRAGMMREVQRQARRLQLDPVQAKRLEESAAKAYEQIAPHFGTVLDPQAAPEEKEQAFVEIKNEMDEVNRDAESYMTPEQHEEFTAMQQTQAEQFERFQSMMSSGGLTPPATGGAAGGGQGNGEPQRTSQGG